MSAPLRLLLADDHTLLRQSLRRALEAAGHEVVAEAGNGEEAVREAERTRPHAVVVDITMPGLDGFGATRRIASMHVPVIVLTMHGDPETRQRAEEAGACCVLTKDCAVADLVAAVEERALARVPAPARAGRDRGRLSERELDVLRLLATGSSTHEVGEKLFISAITVKNHLASIYRKLGCRGRTEAVVYALTTGIAA